MFRELHVNTHHFLSVPLLVALSGWVSVPPPKCAAVCVLCHLLSVACNAVSFWNPGMLQNTMFFFFYITINFM